MPIAFVYCSASAADAVSTIAAINIVASESNVIKLLPYEIRRIQPGLLAVVCQITEEYVEMIKCIARRMGVFMDAPYAVTDHPSPTSKLCILTAETSMWQPCLESCPIPRNTAPGCWGTVSPFSTEELFGIVKIILNGGLILDASKGWPHHWKEQPASSVFGWFWDVHNTVGYRRYECLTEAIEDVRDGAHRIIRESYAKSPPPPPKRVYTREQLLTLRPPSPALDDVEKDVKDGVADDATDAYESQVRIAQRRMDTAPSDISTPYAFKAAKTKVGDEVKLRALHDISRLRQNFGDAVWGWRENLAGEPLQWNWNTRAAAGYAADAECERYVSVA